MVKPLQLLILLLFVESMAIGTLANNREIGSSRTFAMDNTSSKGSTAQPLAGLAQAEPTTEAEPNPLDAIKEKVIKEKRLISQLDSASFFSLPLGVGGGGETGDDYAIIIDKATIYPQYAEFSAFMVLTNPFDGKKVRFRADNVKFSFKSGIQGNVRLALMEALTTKLINNVDLNWLPGSFVEFDCRGFKQIGLTGEIELNKDVFIGVDPLTGNEAGKVKTSFYANFADFNNFLVDISFSPFKIKGFNEAYFTFQNVVLDFSDVANSPNLKFPDGYNSGFSGDMADLWRGLYVQNAIITLSPKFKKSTGGPTSFFASSLVIDDNGLSGIFGANNLLTYKEGRLGDWEFSIDKLAFAFNAGSFQSFTLNGGTILPGSTSPVKYSAFYDADGTYRFGITPSKDIKFNAFAAQVVIDQTSTIEVYVDKDSFVPTATLNGKITFGAPKNESSKDSTFVSFPELTFEEMRISAAPPVFGLKALNYASGKQLAHNKFPITLNKASYNKNSAGHGVFNFDLNINLVPANEDALTAQTNLGLVVDFSGEKWRFKGLQLNKIALHGEKPNAYKLKGEIMFANGDPTYGDGFRGNIDATFGKDINVQALALFGKTKETRYFMVDAFVCVPEPGITCGPFIMNGFGGGLYYKMRQTIPTENLGSEFGKGLSDIIYIPDPSKSIGIKAALKAAIVKKELVDAKVTFEINFGVNGGIEQIAFTGDANILTPPKAVSDAQVKEMAQKAAQNKSVADAGSDAMMRALVSMQMDFKKMSYHSEMTLYVNVADVLKGSGSNNLAGTSVMHIEPGKWYLHMGTPTNPIGLKFIGLMTVNGYFMAGHDIPDAMTLPQQVVTILGIDQQKLTGQRRTGDLATGTGLAFGTSFALSTGDKKFLIFYGKFDVGGGYDVLLLDYGRNTKCAGSSGSVGINGWYAKGQAYAYLNGDIGIRAKVFLKSKKFTILKLATAAVLKLEGPNPIWMMGTVGGEYKILGGLIKGKCKFEVTMGDHCQMVKDGDLSDIAIIGDIAPSPGSSDVDIFTLPQVVFNLPVGVAAKVSDDPKTTEQFRVKLNEISVYQGTTLVPGNIEWDSDKKTLAFTPATIFTPKTKYRIVVKAGFEQKKDSNSPWEVFNGDEGKPFNETKEAEFTTGELPDKIPSNYVTVTYPINRMMNFYKAESNTAYITFKADLAPFFQPQTGWEQKVKWMPLTGGAPIYSALTYNQAANSAETPVPANLTNGGTYSMELVNVPTSSNNAVARNVTETSNNQLNDDDENSAEVTTREAEGVISNAEEKAFYGLKFRCSSYNKFFDKVAANELPVRFLYNVKPAVDYPGATLYATEMFDGYEIAKSETFGPLISIEAVLDGADWYQNNIYPLFYANYPLHPSAVVGRTSSELGLPPTNPVALWQINYNYIMSEEDLNSGVHRSKAEFTHIVNYLPGVWADDYYAIRNQLVNQVDKKTLTVTPQISKIINTYPWPQVSAGNYPVKIEYRLPGRNTVTSSKVINIKNGINIKQVNLIPNEP